MRSESAKKKNQIIIVSIESHARYNGAIRVLRLAKSAYTTCRVSVRAGTWVDANGDEHTQHYIRIQNWWIRIVGFTRCARFVSTALCIWLYRSGSAAGSIIHTFVPRAFTTKRCLFIFKKLQIAATLRVLLQPPHRVLCICQRAPNRTFRLAEDKHPPGDLEKSNSNFSISGRRGCAM